MFKRGGVGVLELVASWLFLQVAWEALRVWLKCRSVCGGDALTCEVCPNSGHELSHQVTTYCLTAIINGVLFEIMFSAFSQLYRNEVEFYILILYSVTLLKSFY